MKMKSFLPALSLCCLGLALSACQPKTTPGATAPAAPADKSVATVNGRPISRTYFDDYVKAVTQGKKPSDISAEQRAQVLDDLIRHELIAQQATKDGLDKDPEIAFLLQATHDNVLWEASARRYLKDKNPTEQELKAEYDSGMSRLPHTEYHARDILVPTAEAARKIIERLRRGEKFESLARSESTDSARERGGDLGWISPAYIDAPMAEALTKLGPGEYTTSPVPTQGGWRLLQLIETRDLKLPPFDASMRQRITQMLQVRKFQAYTDDLVRNAKIEKTLEPAAAAPVAPAPTATGGTAGSKSR